MLFMALDMDFVYSIGCLRFIHSDWSKFQGRAVYLVFMLYKRTKYPDRFEQISSGSKGRTGILRKRCSHFAKTNYHIKSDSCG